jgi:hypothetical protein
VAQGVQRWMEVTPSQFTHEAEGLALVRALLPGNAPFRAWSNFEFRDSHGKWHEVDLLVLGRRRLHLVELKYYSGTLRGDDLTWRRDRHRAEDSPLKLARRKAQRLASKLQDELMRFGQETGARIPDPALSFRSSRNPCSCTIPASGACCRPPPGSTCSA